MLSELPAVAATALADDGQNLFQQIIAAHLKIGEYQLYWLEFVGILIGVASAWLGMKRWVWAWPVGISASVSGDSA